LWLVAFVLAPLSGAFVAPGLRSNGALPAALEARGATAPVLPCIGLKAAAPSSTPVNFGNFWAGVFFCTAALLAASSRRASLVGRAASSWVIEPGKPDTDGVTGAPPRGTTYTKWIALRKNSKRHQRYHRQHKFLRESGMTRYNGGWKTWHPEKNYFQTYWGKKSHPDNPFFPEHSTGRSSDRVPKAIVQTPTAPMSTSASLKTGSLFAGRQPAALFERSVGRSGPRSALVMKAHKKAASSTRNQGKQHNPGHQGISRKGMSGNAVRAGQILLRQKGQVWDGGAWTTRGNNYTVNSLREGITQWRGVERPGQVKKLKHYQQVFVVPWQYVNEKCTWLTNDNQDKLVPKKYEPWMTTNMAHDPKRRCVAEYIGKLREEWLETEEGKAYVTKKQEKKEKQKEIMKKVWAKQKSRRLKWAEEKGVLRTPQPVSAGSDAEGEA